VSGRRWGQVLEDFGKYLDISKPRADMPGAAHRREVVDLCKVLSVHPDFVLIFKTYAESATRGAALVKELVWEANYATGKLFVDDLLVSAEHVWRYSPIVLKGVQDLGLAEVEGFPEYARALSVEITEPWYRTPLVIASIVLTLVAVLLSGPFAEATGPVGATWLVGIGVVDLGVTAVTASVEFIRKREDEVAAVSSGFNKERFAEKPEWVFWAAITIASALLTAIAVVRGGIRVAQLKGLMKPPPPPPRAPSTLKLDEAGKTIVPQNLRRGTSPAAKQLEGRLRDPKYGTGGERAREPAPTKAPAEPRPAYRSAGPDDPNSQRRAATGTDGVPAGVPGPARAIKPCPMPGAPGDIGGTAGAVYGSRGTGGPPVMGAPFIQPPGRSEVANSSIDMTERERFKFGAPKEAEKRVKAKLEKETGLTAQDKDSDAARILSTQQNMDKADPAFGQVPQPTEPVLLEEPVVTAPRDRTPEYTKAGRIKRPLGSALPDHVLLKPDKVEVFEVTLDSTFIVVEEQSGMMSKGAKYGPKHKVIQLAKAEYFVERFKKLPIVYNIQTLGTITPELIEKIDAALSRIKAFRAEVGATGDFEFILRTDTEIRVFQ
jgi:hypothetical protein